MRKLCFLAGAVLLTASAVAMANDAQVYTVTIHDQNAAHDISVDNVRSERNYFFNQGLTSGVAGQGIFATKSAVTSGDNKTLTGSFSIPADTNTKVYFNIKQADHWLLGCEVEVDVVGSQVAVKTNKAPTCQFITSSISDHSVTIVYNNPKVGMIG